MGNLTEKSQILMIGILLNISPRPLILTFSFIAR